MEFFLNYPCSPFLAGPMVVTNFFFPIKGYVVTFHLDAAVDILRSRSHTYIVA